VLKHLINNPGVIRITVIPAMPKISGQDRMKAKSLPGYLAKPVRIK